MGLLLLSQESGPDGCAGWLGRIILRLGVFGIHESAVLSYIAETPLATISDRLTCQESGDRRDECFSWKVCASGAADCDIDVPSEKGHTVASRRCSCWSEHQLLLNGCADLVHCCFRYKKADHARRLGCSNPVLQCSRCWSLLCCGVNQMLAKPQQGVFAMLLGCRGIHRLLF